MTSGVCHKLFKGSLQKSKSGIREKWSITGSDLLPIKLMYLMHTFNQSAKLKMNPTTSLSPARWKLTPLD